MPNRVNLLMPFLTSTQKCLTIFQTFFCIVILDLTTTLYSLKQAQQLFYLKNTISVLDNPLHPLSDVRGLREQLGTKIRKWMGQK